MTAIEIFKTIALVAGILIAPFIIAALVCVLVVALGLIISLLRFLFTKAEAQQRQQAAGDRPQPTPSDGGFMDIPDGYDDGLPFD